MNRGQFYAYDASTYYVCTFDLDAVIHNLAYTGIYFLTGADNDENGNWYAVSYNGGLYSIDKDTGTTTYIAYTIPLLTLTYNTYTMTWYTSDSLNNFYMINVATGATTYICNFGITGTMTNLVCDANGHLYGFAMSSSSESDFYSINGNASFIGHTGTHILGASFDRNDGTLYVTTYNTSSLESDLAYCDPTTAVVVIINQFSPMDVIDMLIIPYSLVQYDHDVGVKTVNAPGSGDAEVISPEITVKNYGIDDESFPTEVQISKKVYSNYLLEDFEGSFPPSGWTVETIYGGSWHRNDYWSTPDTNYLGTGFCADANMPNEFNAPMWTLMTSPPMDLSAVPGAILDVDSYEYAYYYDFFLIDVSVDGGSTWNNIYKVSQTYVYGQLHHINKDLTSYVGYSDVRFRFGFFSAYNNEPTVWQIDNVKVRSFAWNLEYDQTIDTSLGAGQTTNLTFPDWTPADLGPSEHVDIEYMCEAQTQLVGDQNVNNDLKEKTFTLHYGYFHDVAITDIPSPDSGLAQTQPVEVTLANQGQNAEAATVNVQIGKIMNPEVIYSEDFSGGVLPPEWRTTDPDNWYVAYSNYAGGIAPELWFSWSPEIVTAGSICHTGPIDTTNHPALQLSFKQAVNDYNSDYMLEVQTSTNLQDWTTVYTQDGGPYGPTTTTVTLTGGAPTLYVAFVFVGDSNNINYWYIDDVEIDSLSMETEYNQSVNASISPGASLNVVFPDWTPADIPFATTIDYLIDATVSMNTTDEYPADNLLTKSITLRYEHDVGVTEIILDDWWQPTRDDLIWDNGPHTTNVLSSQLDTAYPFNSQVADDFMFDHYMEVTEVSFVGSFWNGNPVNPIDVNVIFYEDDGTMTEPTGGGMDDPTPTARQVELHTDVMGTDNGDGTYSYDIILDAPFAAQPNTKYWFVSQWAGNYPPQWGCCVSSSQQLHACDQGFPLLGYPYWTEMSSYGDVSFRLMGNEQGTIPYFPSGTYSVAALIKNFGVIFNESNIQVNAKITHLDNNTIIYNHDAIVPGPLAPNQTAQATFPDVTFMNWTAWEGKYRLDVSTHLSGDDNPSNNKKTFTFGIEYIPPPPPPHTYHHFSGIMGDNDWYVSAVIITFTYYDPGPPMPVDDGTKTWPPGINHTYYKLQNEDLWTECTAPISVGASGKYNLSYYSVDTWGNIEPVEGPFPFKIDTNMPVFTQFTVTPMNLLKTKWLLNATVSDQPSGVARVAFYVDSMFVGNATNPNPDGSWSCLYEGDGMVASAIVYDYAGNSAMSNELQNNVLTTDAQQVSQNPSPIAQQKVLRQE